MALGDLHTAPDRELTIAPIAGSLGAEISGVDLAADLDESTVGAIRKAWLEHGVVFFRDQELDSDRFLAFARRIGEPARYPFVPGIEGYPEIIAVTKLAHERVNFGGIWHSDTAYLDEPPMATMLLAREIPPAGGDTMYAEPVRRVRRALDRDARPARPAAGSQQLGARRRLGDARGPSGRARSPPRPR